MKIRDHHRQARRAYAMKRGGFSLSEIGERLQCSRERARQLALEGERLSPHRIVTPALIGPRDANAAERFLLGLGPPADFSQIQTYPEPLGD